MSSKTDIIAELLNTPEGRTELAKAMLPYTCHVCGRDGMSKIGDDIKPIPICPDCGAWFSKEADRYVPDGDVVAKEE